MKSFKRIFPFTLLILSFLFLGFTFIQTDAKANEPSYEIKTITEIGNPTIAGTSAYIDEGVLYYGHGGNTVGYNLDHSNTLFEFDIVLTAYSFPNWLSLTFRASGFDRTQSANLEQKGYSLAFFPAGQIYIWKDGATLATVDHSLILNKKYNFKVGAINEGESVRLILKVDNEDVIDYLDSENAYLSGNWFNICGEGAVAAEIHSTKKIVIPSYYTYTLSTMGQYPTRAGTPLPEVDKYNNVSVTSGSQTFGFNSHLQNFSFEAKFNFSSFSWPANYYISARVGGFDRANSPSLSQKGYSVRVAANGAIEIYKEGSSIATGNFGSSFVEGRDYILEVGIVDISAESTYIFFSVDNNVVASAYDNDSPVQKKGHLVFNGDGEVACKITSSDTKLSPLQTKVEENENEYIISTYFLNPISYKNMDYSDFSERNLKAISINNMSLFEINSVYYALSSGSQVRAVDVKTEDNVLIVTLNKSTYLKSTNAIEIITPSSLSILRTSQSQGLEAESGYYLKQTYLSILEI